MLYIYILALWHICTFCMLVPRILLVIKDENNWEWSKNRFALIWEYRWTEMVEQVMCQQASNILFACMTFRGDSKFYKVLEQQWLQCTWPWQPHFIATNKKKEEVVHTVPWWSALILWTRFMFTTLSVTSARCKHIPQEWDFFFFFLVRTSLGCYWRTTSFCAHQGPWDWTCDKFIGISSLRRNLRAPYLQNFPRDWGRESMPPVDPLADSCLHMHYHGSNTFKMFETPLKCPPDVHCGRSVD